MAFRPLTRKEMFLSAIAGEGTETPKPLTRKERFYNALLGKGEAPEPMTREEVLFKKIVENGGGGGGGSVSDPLIVHSLADENGTFERTNFKSITIMAESVGERAFLGCDNLEGVELVGVKSIGGSAFANCTSLTRVTFPNDITSIEQSAFYNCSLLESIPTIPHSVMHIGISAIAETALTEINYEGTVEEWTALDTEGIATQEVVVHCTDGDATASMSME